MSGPRPLNKSAVHAVAMEIRNDRYRMSVSSHSLVERVIRSYQDKTRRQRPSRARDRGPK